MRSSQSLPRSSRSNDKDLVRELLFSFQGIEGQILRRDGRDGFVISDSQRKKYPASVVQISLRLAELGWLYSQVREMRERRVREEREIQKDRGREEA
jgi:hypothetical protein